MSLMSFEPYRSFRDLDRLSSQLLSGTRVPLAMPMDVWRDKQSYHVAMDLPGVQPDQIDLRVERNTLTVTAQREASFGSDGQSGAPAAEGGDGAQSKGAQGDGGQGNGGKGNGAQGEQVLVAERPMGTFTRQLVLGEGLDTEQVDARYDNGVLHLVIPLAQAAQPRRIQVSRSGGSSQPQVIEGSSEQAQA